MKRLFRFVILCILVLNSTNHLNAQDNTIILMQKDMPLTEQSIFYSGYGNDPQSNYIKNYWDEGKYITSAAYTTKGWLITMAKNCGYSNQSYNYISSWPSDWITEKVNSGFYITSLSANSNNWFIVMSQGTGITSQIWKSGSWSELEPWMKDNWNNEYYITQAANIGSKWVIVMSKTDIFREQTYFGATSTNEFFSIIKQKWEGGYIVTIMEYGNGAYFGVASKMSDYSSPIQQCWVNLDDVNSSVKEYWNKDYNIAYIGGGFNSNTSSSQSSGNNSFGQVLSGIGAIFGGMTGGYSNGGGSYNGSYNGGDTTSGRTWSNCSVCNGTGRCKNCNGTGNYSYSKNGKCGVCLGNGKCAGCRGKGGYYY